MCSTKQTNAELPLNGSKYQKLDCGPKNVDDWLQAWERSRLRNDSLGLLTLTHWGLQLPLLRERDQDSVVRLFCHYLALADGHQHVDNFKGSKSPLYNPFGEISEREIRHKISDKAWTELCNRVFVFSDDELGCTKLKYDWHFRQPDLVKSVLRFLDPNRWSDDRLFYTERANLYKLNRSAYMSKAYKFTRQFLGQTWNYRRFVEQIKGFRNTDTMAELEKHYKFFDGIKPQLVSLMIYYGMVDFLHDKKLNAPTRKRLQKFAFSNSFLDRPNSANQKRDLGEAYGKLVNGYCELSNREAARVLLLYPLLVAGRKKYVREMVHQKLAAKAVEAAKIEAQLQDLRTKLDQVK